MSEAGVCVPEIAWCVMCRGPRRVRAMPIAQVFRERAGFAGVTLEMHALRDGAADDLRARDRPRARSPGGRTMCVIDVDQWVRENRHRRPDAEPAPVEIEPAALELSIIPDLPPQRRPLPLRSDNPERRGRG